MKPLNQWTFPEAVALLKSVEKKTWIIILSCAVGFWLIVFFLVIPAWIQRPMLRREIHSMEAQIREAKALNQKRAGWEADQKVFDAIIKGTQARVFTAEELEVLLGQVSKRASESRVDVVASKPLIEKMVFPAPYQLKYQPSGYEFTVQGGYHDLAELVNRIEHHEKLLKIQSLEIVPAEATPDRHIAVLKLWAILKAAPQVAPVSKTKKQAKAKNVKK